MPRTSTGVDIGHRSAVFLRGFAKGNTFVATGYSYTDVSAADVNGAWDGVAPGFKPTAARVGVTGREVNLRYSRVPRLADWQLRKLMRFEVEEVGGSSDSEVAADFNVLPELPEIEGEDVVLLAMARESLLDGHQDGLSAVGGTLDAFTPNAVALYNAWLRFGVVMDDTVLIANIGHENTDVVLVRGADLVYARNLSGGAALFDQAIAGRLDCSPAQAEKLKRQVVDLTPGARYADSTSEKASRASLAPAGQILQLLQSTLGFAKSQVKISSLKLDRVFICGGGARVAGLDRYFSSALSVPVAPFEPFTVVDVAKLSPEEQRELEEHELESVVALGLAHAGSESEAYSVEIVPAALQRKRDFLGRKAFLIAAAILGVLFLGWRVIEEKGRLAELQTETRRLKTQVSTRERINSETTELVAANEQLAVLASELYGLAASGAQLARTLELLDTNLPDGFWVTDLSSAFVADDEFGASRSDKIPVLTIEGRAEEGVEPNTKRFQRLQVAVQDGIPEAVVRGGLSPDQRRFNLTLSLLAAREAESDETDEFAEDEQDG